MWGTLPPPHVEGPLSDTSLVTTAPTFNTAVFFDIENVLGGYDNDAIATVSISQIMDIIRQEGSNAGLISSVAVNRAYANWSIARLSVLRREIVEQGIEPKQIFGFDRGEKKNAADIELVIDAIDLAYTRPALTTFVIVSGDGGFSSLVKKLHELGKAVVVCAHPDRISPALRAVCDVYVDLGASTGESRDRARASETDGRASPVTDPRLRKALEGLEPLTSASGIGPVRERALDVVRRVAASDDLAAQLRETGLTLGLVGQALSEQLPGGGGRVGFGTPKALLQHALADSEFALAEDPEQQPPHPRVVLREAVPQGLTMLPDRDARVLYKTVLQRDLPRLFVADPEHLHQLVLTLIAEPPEDEPLAEMIERVGERLEGSLSTEHVKFSLGAFVAAGVFDRSPPNERLINQTLSLRASMRSEEALLAALRQAVETKLRRVLGGVDERTVDAMFDRPRASQGIEAEPS